ncbi:hypothetical protein [Aquitalea sp. ASV15]|uniref:hypothetical protein n=1 Tax=Aquitalea sp. ASV15 TaxID=2795104 RepID=UPI0018EA5AB9|nr:hypothetical protein [Aquitalea sp. ASV15]
MKLTLLMPGLSWLDAHDGAEVCRGLALPALSILLGRGSRRPLTSTLSQLYQQPLGMPGASIASQLAQRAGLGAGHWLLADPVHVRIDRDRALLADVGVMSISQHEADALLLSLNQHFAEDGLQFHALQPGRWLLQLPEASRASFTPLPDAVGENVNEHLPAGERGLHWSRLLNEMQMLLYIHPLNDEREARGELAVNSVWLWGDAVEAGRGSAVERPDLVLADDELLQLQATAAGLPCDAAPYACEGLLAAAGKSEHVLLVQDALLAAAQYRDAWGWREQLQRMELDWFAPLLQLLKQGQLQQLRLLSHGPAGFELTVSRPALWKFWQRPQAPAALY